MSSSAIGLWSKTLELLHGRVGDYWYNTWLTQIKPSHVDNGRLVLKIHDHFSRDHISEHIGHVIDECLSSIPGDDGRVLRLSLEVDDTIRKDGSGGTHTEPNQPTLVSSSAVRGQMRTLNDKYHFSNFIVGPSNQFAFAASRAVAEKPANAYNPLFLFGGVGLGKTHLINAIGHLISKNNPEKRIIYISSEEFMNEVINGIRFNKMDEFHNKYRRHCDVLLMDDIQLIAGKDRTQEEFFHTFNTLYESKRQIVVSSDKLPHEIPGLEERMRTRFQWGLIADIQAPEFETRLAILRKKAETEGFDLPGDVAMFLGENIRSNVRELEGALIRIIAHSSLTGQRVSIEYAKQVLAEILAGRRNQVTVESIQKLVATHYDVKVSDLKSQRRHKVVAKPRQVAMYLCRKILNTSYPELGERFGGKDHTTILSACKKIELLVAKDTDIRNELTQLRRKIEE